MAKAGTAVLRTEVSAVTIAADLDSLIGTCPFRSGTVIRVSFIPRTAIVGAAANNSRTVTLFNRGQAGAGVVNVATLPLVNGVNPAADVAANIPLNAAAANLHVIAGDVLDWTSAAVTAAGGLVDPGGMVEVEIAPNLM